MQHLPARWAILLGAAMLLASGARAEELDALRLSQIQIIGTHNSYHLAPDASAARFLKTFAPAEAVANDYSHRPLREQLERLGVRQLELDLFLDPAGKLYQDPVLLRATRETPGAAPPHDPDGLLAKPGIKILHSPDFEFRTTVYTLASALEQIKAWSDAHRDHTPLFVLLELKSESFSPVTRPPPGTPRRYKNSTPSCAPPCRASACLRQAICKATTPHCATRCSDKAGQHCNKRAARSSCCSTTKANCETSTRSSAGSRKIGYCL